MSMRIDVSVRSADPHSGPVVDGMPSTREGLTADDGVESWGSLRQFMRLTGVDELGSYYWIVTVWRPAHRVGHPFLNIVDCPGCLFETAAVAA